MSVGMGNTKPRGRHRALVVALALGACAVALVWLVAGPTIATVGLSVAFLGVTTGIVWLTWQIEDLTGQPWRLRRPPSFGSVRRSAPDGPVDIHELSNRYAHLGQRMRQSLQLRDDESRILEMIAEDTDTTSILRAVADMLARHFPGSRFRFVTATAGRRTEVDRSWPVIAETRHDEAWVLQALLDEGATTLDPETLALAQDLARLALEKARDRKSLQYQADHDSLTGLLSRRAIFAELDRCMEGSAPVGLIYGDVDCFKAINDRHGHLAGDQLLAEIARRMRVLIEGSPLMISAGRLGGDEFLCLIDGCTEDEAHELARRFEFAMQAPFSLGHVTLTASLSWGVALSRPSSSADGAELLREADVALYEVKRNGRNGVRVFDAELRAWTIERKQLEDDLAKSITTRSGVHADFQPQFDAGLNLVGFEALGRWHRQGVGIVAPSDFIPVAVEGGLMADFDAELFRHVAQVLGGFRREGQSLGTVSINVSAERLERPDFVESTLHTLRTFALDPRDVVLEITESSLLRDLSERGKRLEELRRWGLRIAIDDFGTGYSSLSYLRRLPADIVKLDKEFVADVESSAESRAIIEAIMALAQALDLIVVAEGIERQAQFDILAGFGCDLYQGYLFGRPQALDAARTAASMVWPPDPSMAGYEWGESLADVAEPIEDEVPFSFSSVPRSEPVAASPRSGRPG